jgi:hypothetical protein
LPAARVAADRYCSPSRPGARGGVSSRDNQRLACHHPPRIKRGQAQGDSVMYQLPVIRLAIKLLPVYLALAFVGAIIAGVLP